MKYFGKRVKELRMAKLLTKEEFCGDESELSVRQLTRIENGQSMPTLSKVDFIAHRLEMRIGDLTDEERFELPKRYQELKYLLLHTQTYKSSEKITIRTGYFEEIYATFFDELPEEEQLIIEILDSHLELIINNSSYSATKLLSEYLEQIFKKRAYEFNDLIFLHLYFSYVQANGEDSSLYNADSHYGVIKKLLEYSQEMPIDQLFLFNRVLVAAFGGNDEIQKNPYAKNIISTLESNIARIQDLHRTPILNLMKWKYELYNNQNIDLATNHFKNALSFAELTQEKYLVNKLQSEWEMDLSHFASK